MERDLVDRFLDQVIEGYLLEDLRTMAEAHPASPPPFGGVGYPMLATTAAGIELLGLLLMPDGFSFYPNKGRKHFLNYWNEYLVPTCPAYRGLGNLFYQLVRHGIAHSFSAKGNILVTRGQHARVSVDREHKRLTIDCIGFFKDFEASYQQRARPILRGLDASPPVSRDQIRSMLDGLLADETRKAVAAFGELPPTLEAEMEMPALHIPWDQGPTGPAGGTITPAEHTGGTITPR